VVGHTPATVPMEMEAFKVKIGEVFSDLDHSWSLNEIVFSKQDKLYKTIQLTAALFVYFLEIHPFANGNGHIARLLLV
jgi:prophage maintenance system killer protein